MAERAKELALEIKDPRMREVLYLKKQLETFESYRGMVAGRAGSKEEYEKLKEQWQNNKEEVKNLQAQLPRELFSPDNPDSYLELNRSEGALRDKLQQLEQILDKEGDKTSAWTPKGIWGHKDPLEMTLEEKQKMLKKAKFSGPLATAYWENEIASQQEQPERKEAETERKRIKELEEEVLKLNEKIVKAKKGDELEEMEMNRGLAKSAKEEAEDKKKGMGERFKDEVNSVYNLFKKKLTKEREPEQPSYSALGKSEEKTNGQEVRGWFAERAKGFVGGFGWWEAHQAEKFRLGTKKTGEEAKIQAKLLEQEAGLLDEEEARIEAYEIEEGRAEQEKDWVDNYGAAPKEARRLAVNFLSEKISGRKREYNKKVEDKIIVLALKNLEASLKNKSWLEQYKAAHGGAVITPEKMQLVEQKMREEMGKLRKGQMKKDLVDFVKLSRQALDKNWWSRYIYAGLDAVLAGLMLKWVAGKYFGGKVITAAGEKVIEGAGGQTAQLAVETGLKDTIWVEAKRMLVEQGISNPTEAMIQEVSTSIAQDSGVEVVSKATGEVIWSETAGGMAKDIVLQKGFPLKLQGANEIIAVIKSGLGLI